MPCLTQTRKFTLAVCTFAKPNRGAVPLQSTSQKRNNRQPYSVQRTCYKNITQLLIFVAFPAYFFYVLNVPHHTAMLCSRSICHFAVQTAMQKLHNSRINNNKKCSQKQHIFSRCTVRSKYLFSFFIPHGQLPHAFTRKVNNEFCFLFYWTQPLLDDFVINNNSKISKLISEYLQFTFDPDAKLFYARAFTHWQNVISIVLRWQGNSKRKIRCGRTEVLSITDFTAVKPAQRMWCFATEWLIVTKCVEIGQLTAAEYVCLVPDFHLLQSMRKTSAAKFHHSIPNIVVDATRRRRWRIVAEGPMRVTRYGRRYGEVFEGETRINNAAHFALGKRETLGKCQTTVLFCVSNSQTLRMSIHNQQRGIALEKLGGNVDERASFPFACVFRQMVGWSRRQFQFEINSGCNRLVIDKRYL